MKTVKEVSELTGISIRTLRYYDEINLLKPAKLTEAGYRLYDEKSLKELRQIMFFRELEVPLSEIKAIMGNPDADKRKILEMQKWMLEMKRNRLNGIIELISD
ncbi:MAG: MerR family transcriptional regulator [Lachnospiraceae bacterium]|nr:MerR family transcriptional regulator [Lachnospiraceae bacterium]MDY4206560.1 MerR family transcriptional regulator [Lachnospiraceae bacterium]